jgi:hypothetical protein
MCEPRGCSCPTASARGMICASQVHNGPAVRYSPVPRPDSGHCRGVGPTCRWATQQESRQAGCLRLKHRPSAVDRLLDRLSQARCRPGVRCPVYE